MTLRRRPSLRVRVARPPWVLGLLASIATALAFSFTTLRAEAGPAPTSAPTTQAARSHARDSRIHQLISQLGAAEYSEREEAQSTLARLGETVMPYLVEHVGDPNPEIANRVAALIKRPSDSHLRVETAVRLLATADPDWMETGVYMIFESPLEDYELFVERTRGATGIQRAIFTAVGAQFKEWFESEKSFRVRDAAWRKQGKTEAAEKLSKMQADSMYYQAEAAYQSALSAAEDYSPGKGEVAAKPKVKVPTSAPSERIPRRPHP